MTSRIVKAPDGLPYPRPRILVSRREQTPYCFGFKPIPQPKIGPRKPLHTGATVPSSLVVRELGGPFPCDWTHEDRPLLTGDYALEHPEHGLAMEDLILVETKRADLAASLTAGHDQLMAEMQRMSVAKERYLIAAASYSDLIEGRCGCSSRVKAMVHCVESIAMKYHVQVRFPVSPAWAEYVTALVLWRAWCGYLEAQPESLKCARAREGMAPTWVQYDAPNLGRKAS